MNGSSQEYQKGYGVSQNLPSQRTVTGRNETYTDSTIGVQGTHNTWSQEMRASPDEEPEDDINPATEQKSEEDPNDSAKKKDKKLVFLSRSVLKCVRENPMTTGTEIANEILELYKQLCDRVEFKNVQRRVYDALNVLSAMKIIFKHKNNILYNEDNSFIDDDVQPSTVPMKGSASIKSQN